jgi:hypothetical protein
MTAICSAETAAMVGSIFHCRYCRIAIGRVVCPGVTNSKEISRLPKLTTKLKSAAATIPGQIRGSVTLSAATSGDAPRLSAASSTERSTPIRLAVIRRMLHGMVIRTCPTANPQTEPTTGSPVRTSNSTKAIYRLAPITIAGTISGDIRS